MRKLHIFILFLTLALFGSIFAEPMDRASSDRYELFDPSEIPDDPEAYRAWKDSLALSWMTPRTMRPMVLSVENGYVDVNMEQSYGDFQEGGDPLGLAWYDKLTYRYPTVPWDFSIYKIDGHTPLQQYRTGPDCAALSAPNSTYISNYDYKGDYNTWGVIYSVWNNIHGVKIVQTLEPDRLGSSPGVNEQIKYTTLFIPVDGSCHNCGCLKYYDTKLDTDDGAPISTSFGYSGLAEIFFAPGVPSIWRAYEGGYPPMPWALQALGILIGFDAVMPDVFWCGRWPVSYSNGWNDSYWVADATGDFGSDTATMVKWYPRYVCPGDTLRFTTYYGIGELESWSLNFTHTPPDFTAGCYDITPNPASFEIMVTNGGTSNATGVTAEIIFTTPGVTVLTSNPMSLGTISGYGGTVVADWDVQFDASLFGTTVCYDIIVRSSGGSPLSEHYCVNLPRPAAPEIAVSAVDTVVCGGGCTQLNSSITTESWPPYTYRWSPGTGLSNPNIPNPLACPTSATTYTLTVTDSRGCEDTESITIYISNITADAGRDHTICEGESVEIGGRPSAYNGIEPYSYSWDPRDYLTNPTAANPTATPSATITYTLTVTDGIGCTSTDRVTITISNIEADAGLDQAICAGEVAPLGGRPTAFNGIEPYSYTWDPRAFLSDPTVSNPTATPPATTTYIVTVVDNIGCTATDTVQVAVSNVTADAGTDYTICARESAPLGGRPTASDGIEPYSYSWEPMAFLSDPFSENPMATPGSTVTYVLTVTDSIGCNAYDTVTVAIADIPRAEVVYPDSCGYITSCEEQYITFIIWDSLRYALDETSFLITVDGISYDISADEVTWSNPYLEFHPSAPWENGDTIFFSIDTFANEIGCRGFPVSCSFIVDLQPPIPSNPFPPNDTIININMTDICIDLYDSISGLDTSSIFYSRITIGDSSIMDFSYTWDGTTLCFTDLPPFNNGEEIEICLDTIIDAPDYDYCAPNDTFYCWHFMVILEGPVAAVIHPMPDSITACNPDSIVIYLDGTIAPIDESTIELFVDDVLYTILHPWLIYNSVADLLILYPPPDFWEDGDTVTVELARADDTFGTPLADTLRWSFIVDYFAPYIWGESPLDGSTVATATPEICVSIYDSVSGLNEDSVFLVINDTLDFRIGDPGVSWDGTRLCLDPAEAAVFFVDSEWVEVCVRNAWDTPDYCSPNDTTYCWDFFVSLSGPEAVVVQYTSGAYVACDSSEQMLLMVITDSDGIFPESIEFQVDDVTYGIADDELVYRADTLIFIPGEPWTHSERVEICLNNVVDSLGNPMSAPVCWSFIMDLSPPVAWDEYPPEGTILPPWADSIFRIILADSLAGIDDSSIYFELCGTLYRFFDAGVTWDGETLNFDPSVPGIDWDCSPWCVHVGDLPDYCGPNDTTYCHTFIITDGPHAEILEPLPDQVTACDDQCIYIHLWDDDLPVGESSIILVVEGDSFYVTDSELDYRNDSLIFCTEVLWVNDQVVDVVLISADDSVGAHLIDTLEWSFEVDLEAPLVSDIFPLPGATVSFTRTPICFDLTDNLSGVNWDSVWVSVDGTWFSPEHPAVVITPPRVCFYPDSVPISWEGGDTANVCVRAIDSPDLCSPNVLDSCWFFVVEPGGPIGIIDRPDPGIISACADEHIEMQVLDDNGVDASTIQLLVSRYGCTDTSIYDISDPELGFTYPDLIFLPDRPFVDAESICACLIAADDSLGNPLEEEVCWSFVMDLSPPVMWDEFPRLGDIIPSREPVVYFSLRDDISGLDISSITLTIAGRVYLLSDPAMSWDDSVLVWNPALAGTTFSCGDLVEVCLHAEDSPTPGYCGPNVLDTCWTFSIETGGPEAEILRPFDGAYSSCTDEHIEISLLDGTGIDTLSIILRVNTVEYDIGTSELAYDPASGMLVFAPTGGFPDSAYIEVELVAADDILGCPLETPLLWHFTMDRNSPVMFGMNPDCGDTVAFTQPEIRMFVLDSISGLDMDSLRLLVDGAWYYLSSTSLEMRGDTLIFSSEDAGISFPGGYVVEVCLHAIDLIDYCDDNILDTCCSFVISPGGPIGEIVRPENDVISACTDEYIAMQIFDGDGVVDSTIVLEVSRYGCTAPVSYTTDAMELTFTEPDLLFTPSPPFIDGEVVCVTLLEAEDALGNTLTREVSWSFTMDLSPPVITSQTPLPGGYVSSTAPTICVGVFDDISGVNVDELYVRVNSTGYHVGDDGVTWAGNTICFDPSVVDTEWAGGDVIDLCIYAIDSPDSGYCDANVLDSCWSFTISPGGPIGTILRPLPDVYSACEPESIIMKIVDPESDGVNDSTILLEVGRNGCRDVSVYDITDGQLTFSDSILVFFPDPLFTDAETVCVSLLEAEDNLGNTLSGAPISWRFIMDLSPPVVWNECPQHGAVLNTRTPTIGAGIRDSLSGLTDTTIYLSISVNSIFLPAFYYLDDPAISLDGTCISWDPVAAGVSFSGGDLVTVCVYAEDSPDSGYCFPNALDTCWNFTIETGGPVGTVIRPLNETYSACISDPVEHIEMLIEDEDGVVPSSIRLTVARDGCRSIHRYNLEDGELEFSNDTLYFYPEPAFTDAETICACLDSVDDYLANNLSSERCWEFYMDLSPPSASFDVPGTAVDFVQSTQPQIVLSVDDLLSGVNANEIVLNIDETPFGWGDFHWTPNSDLLGGVISFLPSEQSLSFPPGDTVELCIYVEDSPDYCDANFLETCWEFTIEPAVECYVHPNPFTPNNDRQNDYTIFDYPSVFSTEGELTIYNLRNIEIYRDKIGPISSFNEVNKRSWDGRAKNGKLVPEGIYIYVIEVNGKMVCNGTIIIAR